MSDLRKIAEGIVSRGIKAEKAAEQIIKDLQDHNSGELKGKVFLIDVPDGPDGPAFGFCYKPNRTTLGAAISQLDRDPLKANEILIRNSWIGGDERLIEDDDYFFAVLPVLGELLSFASSSLKKI